MSTIWRAIYWFSHCEERSNPCFREIQEHGSPRSITILSYLFEETFEFLETHIDHIISDKHASTASEFVIFYEHWISSTIVREGIFEDS